MLRYLSDDWLAAADEAVRQHAGLHALTADLSLVIGQTVTGVGAPAGDVTYRIRLDHGDNAVLAGPGATDVSFTTDAATAVAIAAGTQSAQTAFLAGRIRLGGDVRLLITHQDLLADLEDVLGPVRAHTSFTG